MSLPEEIIIQIVHAVESDKKWFSERSTVSRAFAKACQQWLYKTVAISSFNGQRRCQKLYHLLSASPQLARYVQDLFIQVGLQTNNDGSTSIWLLNEPLVPSLLLDMLPALRSISLSCSSSKPLKWSEMPSRLQQSFQRLFALSSLRSITLSNLWMPACILERSMGLIHLSVRRVLFTHSHVSPESNSLPLSTSSPLDVAKPRLKYLDMTSNTDATFVNNLSSALDLSDLRELVLFDTDQTTVHAVSEIMHLSVQSLTSFKWDVPETFQLMLPSNDPSGDNDRLSPLFISQTLKHLEVGVHDWPHSDEMWNPIAWAVRALHTVSESNIEPASLETLTIWILTQPYLQFGTEVLTEKWWRDLDHTLSQRAVFPLLRRVQVTSRDPSLAGNSRQMWNDSLRTQMPRLNGRNILVIE